MWKLDGASSEKQTQNFDALDRCGGGYFGEQAKFYANGGNADYSANIGSHLADESMKKFKQKNYFIGGAYHVALYQWANQVRLKISPWTNNHYKL